MLRDDLQRKLDKRLLRLLERLRGGAEHNELVAEASSIVKDYEHEPNRPLRPGTKLVSAQWKASWSPNQTLAYALFGDIKNDATAKLLHNVFWELARLILDAKTELEQHRFASDLDDALCNHLQNHGHNVRVRNPYPPRGSLPTDPIEEVLSGQLLELYQFLRERPHSTSFDVLRAEDDFWRKPSPDDNTIVRALRRLQNELNTIDRSCVSLSVNRKNRRTKLDRPE